MSESFTRRFVFRGRVQGVGFRWTCQRIAEKAGLSGFVSNLNDGRVELVLTATDEQVDAFLTGLQARMADNIEGTEKETLKKEEIFFSYTILMPNACPF